MKRLTGAVLGAGLAAGLLAGCGGSGPSDELATDGGSGPSTTRAGAATATTVPWVPGCDPAPLTVRLQGAGSAGRDRFRATDAVARRVPILPGAVAGLDDVAERGARAEQAAATPLAAYTLYVADFAVPRDQLTGAGLGVVAAPAGKVVAALTVVPASNAGLAEGDVIDADHAIARDYDATTALAPLALTVAAGGGPAAVPAGADVTGTVAVRQLTDHQLCLAVDLEVTDGPTLVAALRGTIAAEVVRPPGSVFSP